MNDTSINWLTFAVLCLAAGSIFHSFSSKHHRHDDEVEQPLNPMVSEASYAVSFCEQTGGEMLLTEYNSKTGLTLNCFYPGDKLEKLDDLSNLEL
jgi:putative hemolysin